MYLRVRPRVKSTESILWLWSQHYKGHDVKTCFNKFDGFLIRKFNTFSKTTDEQTG